ncbi:hypothetical protein B0T25DRAFT_353168 [Lasiosphaeria hispida]|uniref:Uncharacterized protein n=1 Tax=Lasiosphaeria hispida TaxID=260671 RepID=A0AAJ0M8L6_9PEZI|nr:hypothetical protein B0T25DRAFT_353168 [Lasiosphaeria hispida]
MCSLRLVTWKYFAGRRQVNGPLAISARLPRQCCMDHGWWRGRRVGGTRAKRPAQAAVCVVNISISCLGRNAQRRAVLLLERPVGPLSTNEAAMLRMLRGEEKKRNRLVSGSAPEAPQHTLPHAASRAEHAAAQGRSRPFRFLELKPQTLKNPASQPAEAGPADPCLTLAPCPA